MISNIKGWAPTLVLKHRPGGTGKWPTGEHYFQLKITLSAIIFDNLPVLVFLVPNHTIGLSTLAMLQKDFNRERSSHLRTQLNELRYKRHQKRATYFATMPKNELKSKVACFTCQLQVAWIMTFHWIKLRGRQAIHGSLVTCCKTRLPWAGKTRNLYRFCCKK